MGAIREGRGNLENLILWLTLAGALSCKGFGVWKCFLIAEEIVLLTVVLDPSELAGLKATSGKGFT